LHPLLVRRDLLLGALLLVLGLGYGVLTAALPNRSLPNTPGPAFFPWLISAGLVLLAVALLVQALSAGREEQPKPSADPDPAMRQRALALVLFAIYIVALPSAGFIVASVPFFGSLMWIYGERNRFALVFATAVLPIGLFYLFRAGFQILLPSGVW